MDKLTNHCRSDESVLPYSVTAYRSNWCLTCNVCTRFVYISTLNPIAPWKFHMRRIYLSYLQNKKYKCVKGAYVHTFNVPFSFFLCLKFNPVYFFVYLFLIKFNLLFVYSFKFRKSKVLLPGFLLLMEILVQFPWLWIKKFTNNNFVSESFKIPFAAYWSYYRYIFYCYSYSSYIM